MIWQHFEVVDYSHSRRKGWQTRPMLATADDLAIFASWETITCNECHWIIPGTIPEVER